MEELTECQIEIKKLRESTGMNRKEFCEHFDDTHIGQLQNGKEGIVMRRIMSSGF